MSDEKKWPYEKSLETYSRHLVMSKNSVSPSGDLKEAWVFLYIIIAFIISLGIPYAYSICSIFDRSMESNAFEKSAKMITAGSCFCFTPSIIRFFSVNVWAIVDLFSQKPFWLSRSIFSSTGLILCNSSLLYILAAIGVKLIPV